ncbi:NAD(P)/FAD-dependent oxidoreductase [Bogoriella caseilytica]|uniref:Thioredoxin reductase n=1 Tax=Bogoriella caseilytica TaxID=56055 RepID=A0A3N2BFZ8_9MICO|nr:NAD(P)/FAD-dependent oxidoreductase [Bogoriella caseilytica]ROR74176.1 thioredoxin reductase [Bogoriella caseilytica]
MTTDTTPWDNIVVGGGAAGMAAALTLGRALRRVLIVDAGSPRNRFAEHMHTVLGHEGLPPRELLRRGAREVAQYGVVLREGNVSTVREQPADSGPRLLQLELDSGERLTARTVIAATGVSDQLPPIPGLAERWGRTVLHCPYCHGWEVRGQRLGVLATSPMNLHQAELLRQWTEDLTFFSAGAGQLDDATAGRLRSRGVVIEPAEVIDVRGDAPDIGAVVLSDGREIAIDALFTGGQLIPNDGYLAGLNLERAEGPVGSFLQVDASSKTSHARIWAPGNLSVPMGNVPMAISAGTMAGAMANMAMVTEDFDLAVA